MSDRFCSKCLHLFTVSQETEEVLCPLCGTKDFVRRLLAPGEKLGGCSIIRHLSSNGLTSCYLAEQTAINRQVRLKVLDTSIADHQAALAGFLKSAKNSVKFTHSNIVSVINAGREKNFYYNILPYIEGRTLAEILTEGKKYTPKNAIKLLLNIAEALQSICRKQPLYNGDLSPDNLILSVDGDIFLQDFWDMPEKAALSAENDPSCKRVPYRAPELVNKSPNSPSCDIYTFGAILFHMTTGIRPYPGFSADDILQHHANAQAYLDLPSMNFRPYLDPRFAEFLEKLATAEPAQRMASWDEVITAAELFKTEVQPIQKSSFPTGNQVTQAVVLPTPAPASPAVRKTQISTLSEKPSAKEPTEKKRPTVSPARVSPADGKKKKASSPLTKILINTLRVILLCGGLYATYYMIVYYPYLTQIESAKTQLSQTNKAWEENIESFFVLYLTFKEMTQRDNTERFFRKELKELDEKCRLIKDDIAPARTAGRQYYEQERELEKLIRDCGIYFNAKSREYRLFTSKFTEEVFLRNLPQIRKRFEQLERILDDLSTKNLYFKKLFTQTKKELLTKKHSLMVFLAKLKKINDLGKLEKYCKLCSDTREDFYRVMRENGIYYSFSPSRTTQRKIQPDVHKLRNAFLQLAKVLYILQQESPAFQELLKNETESLQKSIYSWLKTCKDKKITVPAYSEEEVRREAEKTLAKLSAKQKVQTAPAAVAGASAKKNTQEASVPAAVQADRTQASVSKESKEDKEAEEQHLKLKKLVEKTHNEITALLTKTGLQIHKMPAGNFFKLDFARFSMLTPETLSDNKEKIQELFDKFESDMEEFPEEIRQRKSKSIKELQLTEEAFQELSIDMDSGYLDRYSNTCKDFLEKSAGTMFDPEKNIVLLDLQKFQLERFKNNQMEILDNLALLDEILSGNPEGSKQLKKIFQDERKSIKPLKNAYQQFAHAVTNNQLDTLSPLLASWNNALKENGIIYTPEKVSFTNSATFDPAKFSLNRKNLEKILDDLQNSVTAAGASSQQWKSTMEKVKRDLADMKRAFSNFHSNNHTAIRPSPAYAARTVPTGTMPPQGAQRTTLTAGVPISTPPPMSKKAAQKLLEFWSKRFTMLSLPIFILYNGRKISQMHVHPRVLENWKKLSETSEEHKLIVRLIEVNNKLNELFYQISLNPELYRGCQIYAYRKPAKLERQEKGTFHLDNNRRIAVHMFGKYNWTRLAHFIRKHHPEYKDACFALLLRCRAFDEAEDWAITATDKKILNTLRTVPLEQLDFGCYNIINYARGDMMHLPNRLQPPNLQAEIKKLQEIAKAAREKYRSRRR